MKDMRPIPHFGRRAAAPSHGGSLARRLLLVLAAMLLALVAVAGARVVTFGTTVNALEEFRADTVGQSDRIAEVRSLLEEADDAGEAYVETENISEGAKFASISSEIARGFDDLERSGSRRERLLASSARLRWEIAHATIERAVGLSASGDGARLDPFHDGLDEAAGTPVRRVRTERGRGRTGRYSALRKSASALSCTHRSRSSSSDVFWEACCLAGCIGPSRPR